MKLFISLNTKIKWNSKFNTKSKIYISKQNHSISIHSLIHLYSLTHLVMSSQILLLLDINNLFIHSSNIIQKSPKSYLLNHIIYSSLYTLTLMYSSILQIPSLLFINTLFLMYLMLFMSNLIKLSLFLTYITKYNHPDYQIFDLYIYIYI